MLEKINSGSTSGCEPVPYLFIDELLSCTIIFIDVFTLDTADHTFTCTFKSDFLFVVRTKTPSILEFFKGKVISWEAILSFKPGRVAQSVGHLTRKSGDLGSIPGLAKYFRFSFRFFKKGGCQLLAKVCARSTA